MFRILIAILIATSPSLFANDISALFHPYDPTLKEIVAQFDRAEKSIDMALYNMDKSDRNPIITWLKQDKIQQRIQDKQLEVRLIFEGYEDKKVIQKKMDFFEKLGVDVKALSSSKKMHHKFAVIDGFSYNPVLISGSANWSMMSRNHFNENILFFKSFTIFNGLCAL